MRRPSLLAVAVVAAALPAMAFAERVSSPVALTGAFDRIASRGDFDVQVREGSPPSVEILAEPGWAERIEVEVSGGELRLSRKKAFDSARGVLVKVVVPGFRGLSVGGSGKGSAESGPAPRAVNLAVSGSGDLAWKQTPKIQLMFEILFEKYMDDLAKKEEGSEIYGEYLKGMSSEYKGNTSDAEIVRDFMAGMTDDFFLAQCEKRLMPSIRSGLA